MVWRPKERSVTDMHAVEVWGLSSCSKKGMEGLPLGKTWMADSMLVNLWPTVWCRIQSKRCGRFGLSDVWWLYRQGFATSDNYKSEDTGTITPTLSRQTEENQEFKVIFGYVGVWEPRCIRDLGGKNGGAAGWYSKMGRWKWWDSRMIQQDGEVKMVGQQDDTAAVLAAKPDELSLIWTHTVKDKTLSF